MQAAFGEKLKDVQQVDTTDTSSSVASVNAHLDMLRPAIASYGATVEVRERYISSKSNAFSICTAAPSTEMLLTCVGDQDWGD